MAKLLTTDFNTSLKMVEVIRETATDRMTSWDANFYMPVETLETNDGGQMVRTTIWDLKDGSYAIYRSVYTADEKTFIEGTVETTTEASFDTLKKMVMRYCRMYGRDLPEIVEAKDVGQVAVSTPTTKKSVVYIGTCTFGHTTTHGRPRRLTGEWAIGYDGECTGRNRDGTTCRKPVFLTCEDADCCDISEAA